MAALSPEAILFGNPPSPGHGPRKLDFVTWMRAMESLASGGGLSFVNGSLVELEARPGSAEGQFALVLSLEEEAGVYERVDGSWVQVAGVPTIMQESMAAAQAVASAAEAAASEVVAVTKADVASSAATEARAAADASGNVEFFDTKADANGSVAGLPIGQLVEVLADESNSGQRARYRREAGGLVLKAVIGSLLHELSQMNAADRNTALDHLGLSETDIAKFAEGRISGSIFVGNDAPGGAWGAVIGKAQNHEFFLAPSDLDGSYRWDRALRFDLALQQWRANGGMKMHNGPLTVASSEKEKIHFERDNYRALLALRERGLSFRFGGDIGSDTDSALVSPSGTDVPWPKSIMTREKGDYRYLRSFTSGPHALVSGGQITFAHGLGKRPKFIHYTLECLSAEHGYSVGDFVAADGAGGNTTNTRYVTPEWDDTHVRLRMSNDPWVFALAHKTTGAGVGLANAKWQLHVEVAA